MPIYEYRCESCDHRLEKLQKMSEGELVDCPQCERPALKRLISASAFRLTGSGWYETDFKKDNKRNLADSSSEDTSGKKPPGADSKKTDASSSESTSTKADAKKADAKPAAKSAAKENRHA